VILGHEGAGIVESVGEGVTKVKPGKKMSYKSFLPSLKVLLYYKVSCQTEPLKCYIAGTNIMSYSVLYACADLSCL